MGENLPIESSFALAFYQALLILTGMTPRTRILRQELELVRLFGRISTDFESRHAAFIRSEELVHQISLAEAVASEGLPLAAEARVPVVAEQFPGVGHVAVSAPGMGNGSSAAVVSAAAGDNPEGAGQ